jgi:phosphatidylserine/phosphatidylglycerophosphate/cardiolipin synthase-like enzyme
MVARTRRTGVVLMLALTLTLVACMSTPAVSTPLSGRPIPLGAAPAASSAGSGSTAAGASGCHTHADLEACFTLPQAHGGTDASVINHAVAMFNRAGKGDTIRIAMFRWDLARPADALIAAQKRGAKVELVVDHDVLTKPAGHHLVTAIERNDPQPHNVVVCKGSCLPWAGTGPAPPSQNVNHLKLFLFDIGGQRSVAFTSSNLEVRQLHQVNSWLRVTDPRVYGFQLAYFKRLRAQSWLGWGDAAKGTLGNPSVWVYPRHRDPVLATLDRVRCTPRAHTVNVVWAVIQRYDIRQRLGVLQRSGCTVRVVTTRDLIENWLQARVRLADGSYIDLPDNQVRTLLVHDKGISIHAMVGGHESYLVLTGTSNATCGGLLYNDEVMLRLSGAWAFQQYAAHFAQIYSHAHQSQVSTLPVQAHCH